MQRVALLLLKVNPKTSNMNTWKASFCVRTFNVYAWVAIAMNATSQSNSKQLAIGMIQTILEALSVVIL